MLNEIGNFVAMMISQEGGLKVERHIVVALWYKWYQKVQFVPKAEQNKLKFLARSFIAISFKLKAKLAKKEAIGEIYRQLWNMYIDLVVFIYGKRMTQDIEKRSRLLIAEMSVEFEAEQKINIFNQISLGLTNGTSESDLFKERYTETIIKREKKNES